MKLGDVNAYRPSKINRDEIVWLKIETEASSVVPPRIWHEMALLNIMPFTHEIQIHGVLRTIQIGIARPDLKQQKLLLHALRCVMAIRHVEILTLSAGELTTQPTDGSNSTPRHEAHGTIGKAFALQKIFRSPVQ